MGCWGSKADSAVKKGSSLKSDPEYTQCQEPFPLEDNPVQEEEEVFKQHEPAPEPAPELQEEDQKLQWTPEASQWRRLLRNTQSLLAACLYIVSTWVRNVPHHTALGQFLLSLLIAPAFTLAYHLLSQNEAGSYYDGYIEMFAHFPQHFRDIRKRGSPQYKTEINHEHEEGIVRTVNALETGVLFLLMSWLSALLWPSNPGNFAIDCICRCVETGAFFGLHRIYGGNFFPGQFYGLIQPEGMWYFHGAQSHAACTDWRMTPVSQHPNPSY